MGIGQRFSLFWKAFFSPEKVFEAEAKGKAAMADGAINNVLAFLIIPIITLLVSLFSPSPDAIGGLSVGIMLLAVLLILTFIVAALYHFVAGLLGGKGSLEKSYYVLSIFNAIGVFSYLALMAVYLALLGIMGASPVSEIVLLPVLVVVAYTLIAYLFYMLGIAAKSAHTVSSLKGLFSFMVAVGIVLAVILAIMFALFGGMVLGALAGKSALAGVPY